MKTVSLVRQHMTAGVFLCLMIGLVMVGCTHTGIAQEGDEVVDIGDRNQVFIDGRYMDSTEGCRIVVCPPRKTYEKCMVGAIGKPYFTLFEVDGVFRGFHALTKDGIHWRRVAVGTAPDVDDILGAYVGRPTPFIDPEAPPSERYKLFNSPANRILVSSDGASWERLHGGIFPSEALYPRGMDSHNVCFYDTRLDKYVAYVRVNKVYPTPPERRDHFAGFSERFGREDDIYSMRAIGRSVTDDLSSFPMPEVVFEFDEKDPHFGGVSVMDFYTPEVIEYPYAQDAYFLFTTPYLHYEDWYLSDDLSVFPRTSIDTLNVGAIDIAIAASRDGVRWHRYDRKPWITLDPESRLDPELPGLYAQAGLPPPQVAHTNLYMSRGMYLHEDEIWMYYVGTNGYHTGKVARQKEEFRRVVLLKDRFTAVEADYTGGEFTTCPVRFEGEALHLNIETSALGLARVEVQDADGTPIEGYTLDDCDRVHTANTVDRVVTWRGGESDVSALAGQPVRLRFELQFGAKLYAFRFGPG